MFFMGRNDDILNNRHVLVIGFARQGQALARWLPTVGAQVTVTDKNDFETLEADPADYPKVRFVMGDHPEALLDEVDLICVSGGVPLDLPILQAARARRIAITNDAQLFLERCPAPVIGITGSAGKTTTTRLVGEILKRAGYTTWIGGNIGNVLLDVMMGIRPEHVVVMELSSFQLELVFSSPPIAAVLNVTPNHLDRHGTMENYMQAKAQVLAHQAKTGKAVLCRDDLGSRAYESIAPGRVIWFSMREMLTDGAFMVGQRLAVAGAASPDGEPHIFLEASEIPLRGEHNIMNVLAACAITGAMGVPPEVMAAAVKDFKPVEHRLEVVRVFNDITFVNDSIATSPERVLAALRSYEEPLVLLAGGADKKLSWDEMMLLAVHKARLIVAFGRDGDLVVQAAKRCGYPNKVLRVQTLEEAFKEALKAAQPGDVVLLSPGGTSYDAYKDFAARGEHFRQLVMAL